MDIKQQNILIDDFLMIKLTDFSVSINYKWCKDYIDFPMVGTCYYMTPEVLDRKRILVSEESKNRYIFIRCFIISFSFLTLSL